MESLSRSLNFELSPVHDLHFDSYAQQMLEGSKLTTSSLATPTITTTPSASSEFLKKLGATLINSIQLQQLRTQLNHQLSSSSSSSASSSAAAASASSALGMDMEFAPNHVVIDSSSFDGTMDDYQKQLEYDKFMNEIWIGIVLTLILISMVFCICSCFLYHQFKTWKRNYRSTIVQSQTLDIEAVKLHPDLEDPVPEYTLVSGLPTYEAALELLNKRAPNTCALLVYPSVFNVFNERQMSLTTTTTTTTADEQQQQQQQQQLNMESTTPLLAMRPGVAVRSNSCSNNNNNNNTVRQDCDELHTPAPPLSAPTTPATTHSPPSYISLTVHEKKPKSYESSLKKPKADKC